MHKGLVTAASAPVWPDRAERNTAWPRRPGLLRRAERTAFPTTHRHRRRRPDVGWRSVLAGCPLLVAVAVRGN